MARPLTSRRSVGIVERLEPRRLLSDVIPVGPEFRANTYTTNGQSQPSIAMDSDGNFVIAWDSDGQDGDGFGIYTQRYNAAGLPQGDEFLVNTYSTGSQGRPSVAMDANGNFVVVWGGAGPSDSAGIHAQRYDAAGTPQGGEFRVNTYTTGSQGRLSVAMDADGDFVVAWQSQDQDGSFDGIYAQRYDATGSPQGSEFRVNTYTTFIQSDPFMAMDTDGDFAITWYGEGLGDADGIFAQRYSASGIPQGGEFRVNTYTTFTQFGQSIAMDADGNFVVSWNNGSDGFEIYAQRYNSGGIPKGSEFRVNTYTTGVQQYTSVAMDGDGDFVVAWRSRNQDGSNYGVYAQRYNATGIAQGGEFQANTYTTAQQHLQCVAMDADGDFVMSWMSFGQDGSDYGIYAQRYAVVPEVTASSFQFATAPHKLSFTFDRDVSGSLGTDDLVVQNLTTMQTIPASDFSVSYDTLTNIATFSYTGTTAGITGMLPDGNYTATLIATGITTSQGAPLAEDFVHNFRFLQADADNDGRVNLNDFNILAANFGQSPRDFTQGDFNYDTIVNLNDFNILAARFGQVLAGVSSWERSTLFAQVFVRPPAVEELLA